MAGDMIDRPTISIIHATPNSMAPVSAAFADGLPEARVLHLLDEGLIAEPSLLAPIQPPMRQRMARVVQLAIDSHADVVLLSCSAYTGIISWLRELASVPVLAIDEELAGAAVSRGPRVGVIATHQGSVDLITDEASARGVELDLKTIIFRDAFNALTAGRPDEHDRLIAERVADLADRDVIVFGQASMARALPALPADARSRVLTSPGLTVERVRALLQR
jgi:Asp/Glu/hydantoin racemase